MQILIGQNKIQTILSRLHSLMIRYIEIGRLFLRRWRCLEFASNRSIARRILWFILKAYIYLMSEQIT